jgi:hypothetical protein
MIITIIVGLLIPRRKNDEITLTPTNTLILNIEKYLLKYFVSLNNICIFALDKGS